MVEDSRIAIAPRNDTEAYVCWDLSPQRRRDIQSQGATDLTLYICDVTDHRLEQHKSMDEQTGGSDEVLSRQQKMRSMINDAHWVQAYPCQQHRHDCYVSIPALHRDYVAELGYSNQQGEWFPITQSLPLRMYPIQSSTT